MNKPKFKVGTLLAARDPSKILAIAFLVVKVPDQIHNGRYEVLEGEEVVVWSQFALEAAFKELK